MRLIFIFLLFSLFTPFPSSCRAQFVADKMEQGFNAAAASSPSFSDVTSAWLNPASLSRLTAFCAAVRSEKRYLLKELSIGGLVLGLPAGHGGLAFSGRYAGSPALNTSRLGVAYGRALGKKVDLGVAVNYYLIHIGAGYGNDAAIGMDGAINIEATSALHVGLRVSNPVGGHYGHQSPEKIPSVYTMCMAYDLSQSLLLSLETRKMEQSPVDMLMAIHYAFAAQFFVRAGLSTAGGTVFTGFGLSRTGMRLDFVTSYHSRLGLTPGLQFLFGLQKNAE